jgi:DNA recombination protein RmuC
MEEIIIIILISVLLALIVGLFIFLVVDKKNRQVNVSDQKEMESELKLYFQKEYGELKYEMTKLFGDYSKVGQVDLNSFKDKMIEHIDTQLRQINDKVEQRLGVGFEQTSKTFTHVVERLAKIDEAQKKIEALSQEVVSLNNILTDKKTRGVFGEVQLYQLLNSVLGENKQMYQKQKKLSNDAIADAILYAPEPLGMIAIDSKFPLDNYKRMMDRDLGDADRKNANKEFKNDVKKHINDIKDKYIIFNETSDQAIMFIPAEAIFAELIAYHEDLIDYANKNKVWVTSPTTLISTLTMIQMIVKNMERDEQAQLIIKELMKLGEEFKRYHERWDKLKRSIESVSKDAEKVHTTSQKISSKFKHISETRFDEIELEDEEFIELDISNDSD